MEKEKNKLSGKKKLIAALALLFAVVAGVIVFFAVSNNS